MNQAEKTQHDRLCPISAIANRLGVSVRTAYTMIDDGRLPLRPIRLSTRCVRYSLAELENWIVELREGARDAG